MNKHGRISALTEELRSLVDDEFTGKIELNFAMGTLATIIKTEKLKFLDRKDRR